jgi:hypothetical protein
MDPKEYRKQIAGQLAQLAAARKRTAGAFRDPEASDEKRVAALQTLGVLHRADDTRAALELASDASANAKLRAAAIKSLGVTLNREPQSVALLLRLLSDAGQSAIVRSAALSALKVAAFHVKAFYQQRPAYIAALRKAAQADDADLRRRSLAVLAREKDAPTQKRLIAGLEEPSKALVPPDKALLFLSYDVKLDLHDLLQRLVKSPPSEAARLQALRMLAADASSTSLFERVLHDKKESTEARLIALAALRTLQPKKLQKQAIKIVADQGEDDDLREACMVAATTFDRAASPELRDSAAKMQKNAGTPSARRAAKRYLAKRGS